MYFESVLEYSLLVIDMNLIAVACIGVFAVCDATTLRDAELRLSVLTTMNSKKTVNPHAIYQDIHAEYPDIILPQVESVVRNIVLPTIVPAEVHFALSNAFPNGVIDPRDPRIAVFMAANPMMVARLPSPETALELVSHWLIYCINQSRVSPELEWCVPKQSYWRLTVRGIGLYINSLIPTQERVVETLRQDMEIDGLVETMLQEPVPVVSIPVRVGQLLARDSNISAENIATELGISLLVAQYTRNQILIDFLKPSWFLELLLNYGGLTPIDPNDTVLMDRILTMNASPVPVKLQGDVFKAVEIWSSLVVNPLRTMVIDEALFSAVSDEFVIVAPEGIQQYLASKYL